MNLIPDCEMPESEKNSSQPVPWLAISSHPPFRRFLFHNIAWSAAYGGVGAFSVAYLKIAAGYPEDRILFLSGLSFLGGMAGLWLFRTRMDRFGSKPVISLCLAGWVVVLTSWTGFATGLFRIHFIWLLILQIVMGLGFSLINMNNTRLAMCLSPKMGKSHFFALYSVVANVTMGLSPVIWGLMMDMVGSMEQPWLGLQWNRYSFYFAGATLAFVVNFLFSFQLVEPRSLTLDSLLHDLLFISPQRTLMRIWTRRR